MTATSKKRGRPIGWRQPNGKTAKKDLRVTPDELANWKRSAQQSGKSLNQWIRDCCNAVVK